MISGGGELPYVYTVCSQNFLSDNKGKRRRRPIALNQYAHRTYLFVGLQNASSAHNHHVFVLLDPRSGPFRGQVQVGVGGTGGRGRGGAEEKRHPVPGALGHERRRQERARFEIALLYNMSLYFLWKSTTGEAVLPRFFASSDVLERIRDFEVRPTDVWIVTYPKSGTTLTQVTISFNFVNKFSSGRLL